MIGAVFTNLEFELHGVGMKCGIRIKFGVVC